MMRQASLYNLRVVNIFRPVVLHLFFLFYPFMEGNYQIFPNIQGSYKIYPESFEGFLLKIPNKYLKYFKIFKITQR